MTSDAGQGEKGYRPAGFCPHCGYQLDPGRCPECGADVVRPLPRHPRLRRRRRIIATLICATLLAGGAAAWRFGPALAAQYLPNSVLRSMANARGMASAWATKVLDARLKLRLLQESQPFANRQKNALAELEGLDQHDWAGIYTSATFKMFATLVVAPKNGMAARSSMGLLNHADLIGADQDRLLLNLAIDRLLTEAHPGPESVGTEMALVRLESERWLVPIERMPEFCADVNAGQFPLAYYRRISEEGADPVFFWHDPLTGLPQVPARFRPYLLPEPIVATVLGAQTPTVTGHRWYGYEQWQDWRTVLRLNVGRAEGVLPGMRFHTTSGSKLGFGRVMSTTEHESVLTFWDCLPQKRSPTESQPGARLSTRVQDMTPLENLRFLMWLQQVEHR